MEIGKQIKKYRSEMEVSQEELAERIFVARQTISNWENDKNYPDLKSLLLLSSLFGISLDVLIKGDIEQMKEEIKSEDIKYVKHQFRVYDVLLFSMIFLVFPLAFLPGLNIVKFGWSTTWMWIGLGIFSLLFNATLFYGFRLEKLKKKYDINSYKEIVAFYEGRALNVGDIKQPEQRRNLMLIVTFALAVPLWMFFTYYIITMFF